MIKLNTTEITSCRLCKSSDLLMVLDYGYMPMAGGFVPEDDPLSKAVALLRLGVCVNCGLMQTLDSVDPDGIFSKYSYRSSISGALVNHFENLSGVIERYIKFNDIDNPICVDVGCNDGILINPLKARGYDTIGIDPSDVADRSATKYNWRLIKRYMNVETSKIYNSVFSKADIVTACNVLAHTDDIHGMVAGVKNILSDRGVFIIEVQYQESMIESNQFDTVYHEHCSYFNVSNIIKLFQEHGLDVWNVRYIPTHSGSIRVMASHKGKSRGDSWGSFVGRENSIPIRIKAQQFAIESNKARSRIQRVFGMIGDRVGSKQTIAYGAAGRSTILINWCKLDDNDISFVVDSSPLRQNKVVPGTSIKILPPEAISNRTDVIMITAWNYAQHIMKQHSHYKGLWMIPLPDVRFI